MFARAALTVPLGLLFLVGFLFVGHDVTSLGKNNPRQPQQNGDAISCIQNYGFSPSVKITPTQMGVAPFVSTSLHLGFASWFSAQVDQ
jgi:hypothetical protein